jgi:hypothetical protein
VFKCTCNNPDEDNRLQLVVKDGVYHKFYINIDGSLEHYDSDGDGQEIYLECPVCGKRYEFENWDLCLEEVYALRKIDNKNCKTMPITISDLKFKRA